MIGGSLDLQERARKRGEQSALTGLLARLAERQQLRACCANCDWEMRGDLAETRASFRAHRLTAHPEIVPTMPNIRALALTPEMRQAAA